MPCEKLLEQCSHNMQVSDEALQKFLTCRSKGLLDFVLIDIREIFEYTQASIVGADLLMPTSNFGKYMQKLEEYKDKCVLIYCRTGSRTSYVLELLKKMGFKKIGHLSQGIVGYSGKIVQNAPLPNN
ncbi:MAG: rhodanese-like domain-containing protein [Sulfurospirillum sp.]|nr:rhodanese-like domain-containing protein [Sulfurospirillum sp.]